MFRCVVGCVFPDVSKDRSAFVSSCSGPWNRRQTHYFSLKASTATQTEWHDVKSHNTWIFSNTADSTRNLVIVTLSRHQSGKLFVAFPNFTARWCKNRNKGNCTKQNVLNIRDFLCTVRALCLSPVPVLETEHRSKYHVCEILSFSQRYYSVSSGK